MSTEIVNLETAVTRIELTSDDLMQRARIYLAKARYCTAAGRNADAEAHLERASSYVDRAEVKFQAEQAVRMLEAELAVAAEFGDL